MKRTLHKLGIELLSLLGGSLVNAANDTVVVHQLIDDVAWKHTLRAVCYVDFPFQLWSFGKNQLGHLVSRTHR